MSTRSQLETLLSTNIISGGSETTAEGVREFEQAIIDSTLNITDDLNAADGYLGGTLADGKIYVGNGSNVGEAVTPSGDITANNAGVFSFNKAVPICLFNSAADVGNSGTSETDLIKNTFATGQMSTNLDKVIAEYAGIYAGNATATSQLKLYFAGTAIFDSTALSIPSASSWIIKAT